MNLPGIFLGIVLSTFYGAAYHLLRGGGFKRLMLYLILAWIGFWVGQIIAASFNLAYWQIGTMLLGTASVGSLLFLIIGDWLAKQA